MSIVYEVTAYREGPWWVFEIPALDTGGQAASLESVDEEARGIIAAWTGADGASVQVSTTVRASDRSPA